MKTAEIHHIYRSLYRQLCLYALHYLMDIQQAEDAVQDCFVKLWEEESEGKTIAAPRSWLYTAVKNRCLNTLKKLGPGRLAPTDMDGLIDDSEAIDRSAEEAALWKAIDSLPRMQRKILLLGKRDGMRNGDIAQELGLAEQTVRNQLSRALKALRNQYSTPGTLTFVLMFFI